MPIWDWLSTAITFLSGLIHAHTAMLAMFSLYVVRNMPEELFWPLNRVGMFVWCWKWLHDSLKAFMDFRYSGAQPKTSEPPATAPAAPVLQELHQQLHVETLP